MKVMGEIRTTNEYELSNHEKHENNGIIQNHEWTRMNTNGKELFNHEKHERHENIGKIQNHEWTRMDTNKTIKTTKSAKSTKKMG